jgi:hypothetical protein
MVIPYHSGSTNFYHVLARIKRVIAYGCLYAMEPMIVHRSEACILWCVVIAVAAIGLSSKPHFQKSMAGLFTVPCRLNEQSGTRIFAGTNVLQSHSLVLYPK